VEVLQAINFLHNKGYIFVDIKLENMGVGNESFKIKYSIILIDLASITKHMSLEH